MNAVYLSGYVGTDPELRTLETTEVARFRLGVSRRVNGKSYTTWVSVEVYGNLASQVMDAIRKGQYVFVAGSLRSFKGKDGIERTLVVAHTIIPAAVANGNNQEGEFPF